MKTVKLGRKAQMTMTNGVTVDVFPNEQHGYLVKTKDLASIHGLTVKAVLTSKYRNISELVEGLHYVSRVEHAEKSKNVRRNQLFWTKRGIIRFGFYIQSKEQALWFRDWAEEIIAYSDELLIENRLLLKQVFEYKKKIASTQNIGKLHKKPAQATS